MLKPREIGHSVCFRVYMLSNSQFMTCRVWVGVICLLKLLAVRTLSSTIKENVSVSRWITLLAAKTSEAYIYKFGWMADSYRISIFKPWGWWILPQVPGWSSFFLFKMYYYYYYFWLCSLFIAVHGLSLVRRYSLQYVDYVLRRLFLLQSRASRCAGSVVSVCRLSSCGAQV